MTVIPALFRLMIMLQFTILLLLLNIHATIQSVQAQGSSRRLESLPMTPYTTSLDSYFGSTYLSNLGIHPSGQIYTCGYGNTPYSISSVAQPAPTLIYQAGAGASLVALRWLDSGDLYALDVPSRSVVLLSYANNGARLAPDSVSVEVSCDGTGIIQGTPVDMALATDGGVWIATRVPSAIYRCLPRTGRIEQLSGEELANVDVTSLELSVRDAVLLVAVIDYGTNNGVQSSAFSAQADSDGSSNSTIGTPTNITLNNTVPVVAPTTPVVPSLGKGRAMVFRYVVNTDGQSDTAVSLNNQITTVIDYSTIDVFGAPIMALRLDTSGQLYSARAKTIDIFQSGMSETATSLTALDSYMQSGYLTLSGVSTVRGMEFGNQEGKTLFASGACKAASGTGCIDTMETDSAGRNFIALSGRERPPIAYNKANTVGPSFVFVVVLAVFLV